MTLELGPRRRPHPRPRYYLPQPVYPYAPTVYVVDRTVVGTAPAWAWRALFKHGLPLRGASAAEVVQKAMAAGRTRDLLRLERLDLATQRWVPAGAY